MKKSLRILSIVMLVGAVSCTDDITSINNNPKSYAVVPGATLFTNAERNLVDAMTSANVNRGIWRLTAQQWVETTYTDETRYDLKTRSISQNVWNSLYRDVLRDFKEATSLITAEGNADAAQKASQLAIIDVLSVYSYSILVNTFGDVPYTQALDFNNLNPAYDDAATIYNDLLTRLDADIATLGASPAAQKVFPGTADLIYGGTASKWVKFSNSLKLRIGMTLADVDAAKAKSAVESAAAALLMTSNADNANLAYLAATPNTNPVWVDLVQSGRQDFVAANTIVDIMNPLVDPRLPLFFTVDQTGTGFSGGVPGVGNSFAKFSHASVKLTATTFPGVLLDYPEVEFYLAEAAERGFTVAGTATEHYNNAITASILAWGGAAGDATTYLANPAVAYATAAGTWQQKIGIQKYIALYNRGFEAWTELKRLDFPVLNDVTAALSGFPNRFTYPVGEQNLNTASYAAASAKIEGDVVETKLFWDKN